MQYRLPRTNGKYNPNGEFEEERFETGYQYTEEARFCFGLATVHYNNYEPAAGKRCKLFNYTGQKVINQLDCEKKVNEEINHVQLLKNTSNSSPWIENQRANDKGIWEMDDVTVIPSQVLNQRRIC